MEGSFIKILYYLAVNIIAILFLIINITRKSNKQSYEYNKVYSTINIFLFINNLWIEGFKVSNWILSFKYDIYYIKLYNYNLNLYSYFIRE